MPVSQVTVRGDSRTSWFPSAAPADSTVPFFLPNNWQNIFAAGTVLRWRFSICSWRRWANESLAMKAMVLAAGLGTRLRPLTDDRPKALVEVGGRALLEITLLRLRNFGIREVIVNVHHFADQVIAFLAARDNFGMRIEVSREDVLLDTGGGLKKAGWFFLGGSAPREEPFILHNVDVVSTIDLESMVQAHKDNHALA